MPKGGAFLDPIGDKATLGLDRFRIAPSVCGDGTGRDLRRREIGETNSARRYYNVAPAIRGVSKRSYPSFRELDAYKAKTR